MFGLGSSDKLDEHEITDIVGQHLESFIAIFVMNAGKLDNFAVGNVLGVGDSTYAYQFNLHREGTQGYREIKGKMNQLQE